MFKTSCHKFIVDILQTVLMIKFLNTFKFMRSFIKKHIKRANKARSMNERGLFRRRK